MKSSTTQNANAEQLQAINTLDGPVLIVAGPGSGKTYCLVERTVRITSYNVCYTKLLRGVQRVEDGFHQQQVYAAIQQAFYLLAVRFLHQIEGCCAVARVVHIGRQRECFSYNFV